MELGANASCGADLFRVVRALDLIEGEDKAEWYRHLLSAMVYSNNASSGTASHLAAAPRSVNKATRSGE